MLILNKPDQTENEVTNIELYRDRRRFIQSGIVLAAGSLPLLNSHPTHARGKSVDSVVEITDNPADELTPYEAVTSHNNFSEFDFDKQSPAELSRDFRTRPWEVKIDGECHKPQTLGIEDILSGFPMEERIYRLRCVETWSMVIPWLGFPLSLLLNKVEPTTNAKFVEFRTLVDPEQMPNQKRGVFGYELDWPYLEGLRIDEAMSPLTLLATGLYGDTLPNQNGAPIRLVVPWKYGFKSIKSIVSIRLTEQEPVNTWQIQGPGEYGFYANVNPEIDHPRWSQARERRVGEWTKRPTLPFNGYAEQVAHLYEGMDLSKYF